MGDKGKLLLGAAIIGIGAYLYFFEPETAKGLMRTGFRFVLIAVGAIFVGMGGLTIYKGAIRGENDGNSAPVDNPASVSNRGAGLFLGLIQIGVGATALFFAFSDLEALANQ